MTDLQTCSLALGALLVMGAFYAVAPDYWPVSKKLGVAATLVAGLGCLVFGVTGYL